MTQQLDDRDAALAYRDAISRFATGVTIITTQGPHGPVGMTASAVASVSLEPVQLLVCIANRLFTRTAILDHGRFAVNVLAEDDEDVARRFASPRPDKFAGVTYTDVQGVPVLGRAIAHFVCDVSEPVAGGDHTIFVGDVRACDFQTGARPLLYFGARFGRFRDAPVRADAASWRLGDDRDLALQW